MDAEQQQKQQQHKLQQNQLQHQQCYMEKGVMLEPFVHQVAGHSFVLCFGEQTICKTLLPREHQFYKSLPAAIRKFIPQYRGVVSVSFEEDEEGNVCLIAYPLHSDPAGDLENKDPSTDCEPKGKMLNKGNKMASLLVDNDNNSKDGRSHHSCKDKIRGEMGRQIGHKLQEDVELEWMQSAEVLYSRLERSQSNAVPQHKHNPWSLKCHQQHLQRMKENAKHHNQYKFIRLENLTWHHTVPCVLDLKMGTRQHGDDASEEKKAMHIRICQQSTSASIGVRLCGMQVYQSDSGQLMFMNKYHGCKLTLPGFKEALFQFFHNGQRLRRELLPLVLRRLREMQAALEACDSYRFYSSSLLIIYDEEPHRTHTRRHAEDGLSEEEEENEEETEDRGEEEEEEEQETEDMGEEQEDKQEEDEVAGAHGPSTSSCSSSPGVGSRRPGHSDPRSYVVDVRMIDFAHTTCRPYGEDSVVYEGIFGLQNLITIISQLDDHSTD
uniref:inositol hexakisphosphate kinase 2-like n=1 Tax=Centroberyx gerrardi TaxID=166262 RepID=UPI003AABF666